jgi:hypothetical protein
MTRKGSAERERVVMYESAEKGERAVLPESADIGSEP